MTTSIEQFIYNNCSFSTRTDGAYMSINISATTPKNSELYPINKVERISATVTGGYRWQTSIGTSGGEVPNIVVSRRAVLTVNIYLVESDGTTRSASKATASGSANTGGNLTSYNSTTTGTCSYTITNEDRINYSYVLIVYTVTNNFYGSEWVERFREDTYIWDGQTNPSGTTSITVYNSIPVTFDGSSELDGVIIDSTSVTSLIFDGTVIF